MSRCARWPWLTVALAGLALVAAGEPTAWQYDRELIGGGAWWRALGGHFAHWGGEHLRWDLFGWLAIGLVAEVHGPWRMRAAVLAAAALIPPALWLLHTDLLWYRGLSGLVTTALGVAIACWWCSPSRQRRWSARSAAAALALKVAGEAITGHCLLATTSAIPPVPSAHLLGATIGVMIGALQAGGLVSPAKDPAKLTPTQSAIGDAPARYPRGLQP